MNPPPRKSAANEIRRVSGAGEIAKALEARRDRLKRLGLEKLDDGLGTVFEDEYVRIVRDPVQFSEGKFGTYLRIEERSIQDGVSGVVVLPKLGDKIFLHRIYRYPTGSWEWELPRGFLEPGLTPEATARHELAEETGLTVETVQEIGAVFCNTGLLAGRVKVFVASVKETGKDASPEASEVIEKLISVPAAKMWAMAANGEIRDGFTLSAMTLAVAKNLIPPPGP